MTNGDTKARSAGLLDDVTLTSVTTVSPAPVLELLAPSAKSASPKPETPIDSFKNLGDLIRTVRNAKDLSQQELADMAGVGRRFVSELENGKATLEIGRVLTVCQALGIDLVARKR